MLSPLVKTSPANAGGAGSVCGWGANPNSTCLTAKGNKKKKPKHKTEAMLQQIQQRFLKWSMSKK